MRGPLCVLLLAVSACSGDSDDGGDDTDGGGELAIAGAYLDEFGTEHVITEAEWMQTFAGSADSYVFHIVAFDNAEERVVTHNAPENAYNGNQFSAFDWYEAQGDLYICQTKYDAASQDDAEQVPRADETALATGCSGFAWTNLTP